MPVFHPSQPQCFVSWPDKQVWVKQGVLLLAVLLSACQPGQGELYFVDAHSQINENVDLSTIIQKMDNAGVTRTILAPRGLATHQDVKTLAEQHPGRIIRAIRTKGEKYRQNHPDFYTKFNQRISKPCFGAVAEVLLYHAKKINPEGGNPPQEVLVNPTDNRVVTTFNRTKSRRWPYIAHIEYASLLARLPDQPSPLPNRYQLFYDELHSPALRTFIGNQPVVLIHMAQLDARKATMLLSNTHNIYFMTSHASPDYSGSNQPWINMFNGDSLKPEWKALMIKYPDRFIFAVDNVWPHHWQTTYKNVVDRWRTALGELPDNVAHAIAHGNAERLWRLGEYPPTGCE
jgi:predicted TIM-barrel fold metal-dependent hydrolase